VVAGILLADLAFLTAVLVVGLFVWAAVTDGERGQKKRTGLCRSGSASIAGRGGH
jgi:hypothetical protein